MRLGSRIGVSSAVAGLMSMLLGLVAAYYIARLQTLNSQLLDNEVSSMRAAVELDLLIRDVLHELERFLITGDHRLLENAAQKQGDVNAWLKQAVDLSRSRSEASLVAEIRRGVNLFFTQLRSILGPPIDAACTEKVGRLVEEVLTQDVLAYAQQYVDVNEQDLLTGNERVKSTARRVAAALLLLGVCGAIAGLAAGYGLARQVRRSLLQLSVPIRDVAGKLNEVVGPVEVSADPSVAELEVLLQKVSSEVSEVVEELHARHQEAIRADQLAALGQLAAGLAHEFRNPIMCMKTLVQAAKRHGDCAQMDARDLDVLDEEITRLNSLLQAFLDFARPAKLETASVDIVRVVHQTVDLLSRKAEARQVTIERRLARDSLVVQADAGQLRQVLLNLLLNALDAVPNGGHIEVDVACIDGDKTPGAEHVLGHGFIRVRVSDNGRGLPPEERDRIFEPFFSTKDTGLGLGLAISKRIMDAHGGTLVGRDREGGGAEFDICLPVSSP